MGMTPFNKVDWEKVREALRVDTLEMYIVEPQQAPDGSEHPRLLVIWTLKGKPFSLKVTYKWKKVRIPGPWWRKLLLLEEKRWIPDLDEAVQYVLENVARSKASVAVGQGRAVAGTLKAQEEDA